MNTYGVSNMCCTVDWRVPATVGEERLKSFCDAAKREGVKVEMWANTAVSTLALMAHRRDGEPHAIDFAAQESLLLKTLDASADPYVRNPSNAIEADHYTPVFACLNLRDQTVRLAWRAAWSDAHDRLGLEGVFLDSSFNLSSDKHHWIANAAEPSASQGATADHVHLRGRSRPAQEPAQSILTQDHAHLDLVREMQQLGFVYCGEDTGVFGVHRAGPSMAEALSTLPMWTDCIAGFDAQAILAQGADPDDLFFRGLACRMMWMLYFDIPTGRLTWKQHNVEPVNTPTPAQFALLKAFNAVEDKMHRRVLLPDDCGVLYEHEGVWVLWSFRPFKFSLPTSGSATTAGPVLDVLTGEAVDASGGSFTALQHHIYRIGPAHV